MPKRDWNRGFNESLLEFDVRSNPLGHHGRFHKALKEGKCQIQIWINVYNNVLQILFKYRMYSIV